MYREKAKIFELTDSHLKLAKAVCLNWDDCEYGAPCVDPKRPYGNSNVEKDIRTILGPKCKVRTTHKEMLIAMEIILKHVGEEVLGKWIKRDSVIGEWERMT